MAEDLGIGGRAGYYDGIGAARDVIQTHLLQLLALVAMEEPVAFDADSLRMEKEKVLSAVRLPADIAEGTARGQYSAGWQGGRQVHGFLEEDGIPPDSRTETYAALRLGVYTRRWAGVPFYLRAGKRLPRRMTEIALIFQRAPHLPFSATDTEELGQNALVIRIQPDEGITVRFGSKVPGTAMEVRDVNMDFAYGESFTESSPEAYERGIPPDSRTETYAALRLGVDTRRWAGVPFCLRAGKRLPRRMTEIALIFQRAPHLPFTATDTEELGQNALVIRIQPDEGITVRFGSKVPGTAMEVRDVNMDFAYGESFTESSPEAYERLLLDVLIGDPPLFPRQAEVELGWRILDPVEDFWASRTKPDQYPAGTAGPPSADALMARDNRAWRRL